jgi:NAD(P)-dependent dehydrogenase (short-subunit alcohol dehydrogenase family)
LIYLSSGMHMQGHFRAESFKRQVGRISYSDSKLHVLILTKAVARRWTDVYSNAVDPGWVPTRMGGKSAPDDLQKGYETQVWLSVSNDAEARVSGNYFHHQKVTRHNPEADDVRLQERFLSLCEEVTGVSFLQGVTITEQYRKTEPL